MSTLPYGKILYKCESIFNVPFLEIPNFFNKTKVYITTKGILVDGVVEDDSDEKKHKKRVDRNLTAWEIVMVEPDATNDSFNIPLINKPLTPSYTFYMNINKITKRSVKIKGLRKKDIDAIISAGGIAQAFTEPDERAQALDIWSKNYFVGRDLTVAEYKREIALNIVESKIAQLAYFGENNRDVINNILKTAKDMIKCGELTYEEVRTSKPKDIAKLVGAYATESLSGIEKTFTNGDNSQNNNRQNSNSQNNNSQNSNSQNSNSQNNSNQSRPNSGANNNRNPRYKKRRPMWQQKDER